MPVEQRLIDTRALHPFTRRRPWRWLSAAALEWGIILTLMWACFATGFWPLWVVSILIIGTRQHALGILAHESVHFLVSGNRRVNDVLGNLFASYPLTYPVEGYRVAHLKHHSTLDTPLDPERATIDLYPEEWTFPMSRRRAVWLLVRDVFGVHQMAVKELIRYIWQLPDRRWVPHVARVALWHAVAITVAVAVASIWVYLLLWIVPLFTVAVMCFRIRTVAEHSGIYEHEVRFARDSMDTIATTRTITGNPVFQFLFGPYNMCYHVEHHLYPSVPVFELRRLHRKLLENEYYAANAHLTAGYAALFGELTESSEPTTASTPTA